MRVPKRDSIQACTQIAGTIILAITLIFVAKAACTAQSDLRARTRPYLAVEKVTVPDANDDPFYLLISVTNFGQTPATGIELGQLSAQTESEKPWTDIAYIVVIGTDQNIAFPGRPISTQIEIQGSDYQQIIMEAKRLVIRLTYSWQKTDYWYEAEATLQDDGSWSIESQRGN